VVWCDVMALVLASVSNSESKAAGCHCMIGLSQGLSSLLLSYGPLSHKRSFFALIHTLVHYPLLILSVNPPLRSLSVVNIPFPPPLLFPSSFSPPLLFPATPLHLQGPDLPTRLLLACGSGCCCPSELRLDVRAGRVCSTGALAAG
jgi:hypothetical protein